MLLANLGPIFKEARRKAKLSQAELAAPLGMSRATISAIESGRCDELEFSKLSALLDQMGLEIIVRPRTSRPTIDELREELRHSRKDTSSSG
jgi:HTH-type transcriptional regulator/antitoxin HipB